MVNKNKPIANRMVSKADLNVSGARKGKTAESFMAGIAKAGSKNTIKK